MNWFLQALKKYAVFSGRARRKEYWYFILFSLLINIALMVIDYATGIYNSELGVGLLSGLFTLALVIPTIAVTVRMLHDTGRSGWWFLIGFIPVVGGIVLLVFMVLDTRPGTNQYGPSPKEDVIPA